MSAPLSQNEQILEKLSLLQDNLEKSLPGYKDVLRSIHSQLRADPDMVHVLSEEQIGLIVAGLSKHKGVVIATAIAKSSNGGKKAKSLDLGDL